MVSSGPARGATGILEELRPRTALAADPVNFVTGTDGDDVLLARGGGTRPGGRPSKGADLVEGRGGNDRIDASGGNDEIHGDVAWVEGMGWTSEHLGGNDRLKGGAGDDAIWGEGTGGPQYGSCGDDWVNGGPGNDTIWGDTDGVAYGLRGSNDRLFGGAGNDTIRGDCSGIGRVGYGGDDQIFGGLGNDFLIGDADNIDFQGAAGDDLLDGGAGNDLLIGDGLLEAAGASAGQDRLLGGAGNDRLYGDSPLGEDFARLDPFGGELPDSYFAQFGNDDYLDGGTGNDLLVGGFGNDELIGGSGSDIFLFFPSFRLEVDTDLDRILDFAIGLDKLDLTRWGLDGAALDTDENGRLGDGDDAVFGDGEGNLVIDLGAATGRADPDRAVVVLERVTSLRLDDLVLLPAEA